jgi:hypothetical protein
MSKRQTKKVGSIFSCCELQWRCQYFLCNLYLGLLILSSESRILVLIETYLSYTNLYVIILYFNIGARISNEMDELANVELQLGTKG